MGEDFLKIKEQIFRGETELISARIPRELVMELDFLAKETGCSRNEILEKCLTMAVNRVVIEKAD